jgi:hypothetical protein
MKGRQRREYVQPKVAIKRGGGSIVQSKYVVWLRVAGWLMCVVDQKSFQVVAFCAAG